jgi:hypothetical protein
VGWIVGLAWIASVAGGIVLCAAIEHRNRREARREFFGLSAGPLSWP